MGVMTLELTEEQQVVVNAFFRAPGMCLLCKKKLPERGKFLAWQPGSDEAGDLKGRLGVYAMCRNCGHRINDTILACKKKKAAR